MRRWRGEEAAVGCGGEAVSGPGCARKLTRDEMPADVRAFADGIAAARRQVRRQTPVRKRAIARMPSMVLVPKKDATSRARGPGRSPSLPSRYERRSQAPIKKGDEDQPPSPSSVNSGLIIEVIGTIGWTGSLVVTPWSSWYLPSHDDTPAGPIPGRSTPTPCLDENGEPVDCADAVVCFDINGNITPCPEDCDGRADQLRELCEQLWDLTSNIAGWQEECLEDLGHLVPPQELEKLHTTIRDRAMANLFVPIPCVRMFNAKLVEVEELRERMDRIRSDLGADGCHVPRLPACESVFVFDLSPGNAA